VKQGGHGPACEFRGLAGKARNRCALNGRVRPVGLPPCAVSGARLLVRRPVPGRTAASTRARPETAVSQRSC